ncbi:MAG TPA: UbiD family decarboxylase [Thermodesulfobacteriota bacterium]|nr:UbiD family decarboxylase [Thermodesulfobacteriota bacterium]
MAADPAAAPRAGAALDLRGWIDAVRRLGRLREVAGASWRLEIGTLTDLNAKGPKWTLLFDRIEGYPAGRRILTGSLLDAARVALTFGFDPGAGDAELVRLLRSRLRGVEEKAARYRAVEASRSELFANVQEGGAIDLLAFPAPLWHEHDGGRYLGTADAVVTRDPDTGWVNVGTYRVMVHDRRHLGIFINVSHHGRLHAERYWARGEPCPVAISFGHHPLIAAVGGLEVPTGLSEYDYAGALLERPYPVVRGPLTGLPIPADSELAIEGYITREERPEGPYGEFLGYYAGGVMSNPVVEVRAVYHRDDPIILGTAAGRPPYDYSYFRCPIRAAMLWNALEAAGVPGIQGVWCHEAGYSRALTIVSIKQAYAGHASQVAHLAAQIREGVFGGKYVVVVDDDIDPTNTQDVLWAICSRTDPVKSIEFIRDAWGMNLDPMVERGPDTRPQELRMSRALIDACRPIGRLLRGDFPAVVEPSPAVKAAVLEKWRALFERPPA